MHKFTLPILGAVVVALTLAYGVLLSFTVYYASVRTDMAQSARVLEGQVATLESRYFESVASVHQKDVASLGFVHPSVRTYLSSEGRRVEVSLSQPR